MLELERDSFIRSFLHDVRDGVERRSIALKLWTGGTIAGKPTRDTYNIGGGREQNYNLQLRSIGFQEADRYADENEILRAGVQVSTILELIIRQHSQISLEGAKQTSDIRKYLKDKNKNYIRREDIDIYNT